MDSINLEKYGFFHSQRIVKRKDNACDIKNFENKALMKINYFCTSFLWALYHPFIKNFL